MGATDPLFGVGHGLHSRRHFWGPLQRALSSLTNRFVVNLLVASAYIHSLDINLLVITFYTTQAVLTRMPNYRQCGDWMVLWDDRILEILALEGPTSSGLIAKRDFIYVSASNISRRLGKLRDHGLVEHVGNGVYQITIEGRLYLTGKFDAQTGKVLINEDTSVENWLDETYRDNIGLNRDLMEEFAKETKKSLEISTSLKDHTKNIDNANENNSRSDS